MSWSFRCHRQLVLPHPEDSHIFTSFNRFTYWLHYTLQSPIPVLTCSFRVMNKILPINHVSRREMNHVYHQPSSTIFHLPCLSVPYIGYSHSPTSLHSFRIPHSIDRNIIWTIWQNMSMIYNMVDERLIEKCYYSVPGTAPRLPGYVYLEPGEYKEVRCCFNSIHFLNNYK
jgi:hypothetical protein